jgi:hypothetical protein
MRNLYRDASFFFIKKIGGQQKREKNKSKRERGKMRR